MNRLTEKDIEEFSIQAIYSLKDNVEEFSYGNVNKLYEQQSISKIMTSTAIGKLIDDKIITLEDKISDYLTFPKDADPLIYTVKIKDLLTQTMGTHKGFLYEEERHSITEDFVDYISRKPIERKVSKYFEYSDATFYLLSRIVQKASNLPLDEFLNKHFLIKMNIYSEQYERCFNGHPLGCSGYAISTVDICRIGQFYLDKGIYNGERLLSEEYIFDATRKHMRVNSRDKYGFGWWVRKDFYYCSGARNQALIIIPTERRVIAINSNKKFGHIKDFLERIFYLLTK